MHKQEIGNYGEIMFEQADNAVENTASLTTLIFTKNAEPSALGASQQEGQYPV